jgi:hypothetical protein
MSSKPVDAIAETPAQAVVDVPAVNFKDPAQLVKYALKVIAQVEVLSDMPDAEKAAFIVAGVKSAINASSLTAEEKAEVLPWCDVALPYVVQAVAIIKAELKTLQGVALVQVKKCCPSFF